MLTKFTNVSNYGKFMCNIFLLEYSKIKARFGELISKDGLIKSFCMCVSRKFVVGKM